MQDYLAQLEAHIIEQKKQQAADRPFILGIYGPQGSGKTTLSLLMCERLTKLGYKARTVSLDDFYYTRAYRSALSADVHPLLATRGVPGTHDYKLGLKVFQAILDKQPTTLPVFDKAVDDRCPEDEWLPVEADLDFFIFEGWSVGVPDILLKELEENPEPLNPLEADFDAQGEWRRHVAEQNKAYQEWYDLIDYMVGMQVPNFEIISEWRWQQECDLFAKTGKRFFHSKAEVQEFVSYYERVTRAAQAHLSEFVECLIEIDEAHQMQKMTFCSHE
ncbi:MAG: kinase [Pseudomonadota bacterium]|nr:kinase [Pseudomonadota bacterium]